MKPVILGLTNEKSSEPAHAMEPYTPNGAGERLWAMVSAVTNCTKEEYVERFTFLNLLDKPRKERFHLPSWRQVQLANKIDSAPCVVLGRIVWAALMMPQVGWYETIDHFHLIPHPSGRNIIYNSITFRQRTGRLLARLGGWPTKLEDDMTTATDRLRNEMIKHFDSIDIPKPLEFLKANGWIETGNGMLKTEKVFSEITQKEWDCADFLVQEWDFDFDFKLEEQKREDTR